MNLDIQMYNMSLNEATSNINSTDINIENVTISHTNFHLQYESFKIKHAWKSEKFANYRKFFYSCYGETIMPYFVYLNDNGQEIKASFITEYDLHLTNWDDMIYCGIVTQFVRYEF